MEVTFENDELVGFKPENLGFDGFKTTDATVQIDCEKHGVQEVGFWWHIGKKEFIQRDCPECKSENDALKTQAEEDALSARKIEIERERIKAAIGRAAIPKRFENRTLDGFEVVCDRAGVALKTAKGYADAFERILQKGTCLTFFGNVGTGKTHLAIGIAHEIIKRGFHPLFVSAYDMVNHIKEAWSKRTDYTESEAINAFVIPDLLIIDEVGVQFGSDTERLFFFNVMDKRYQEQKPTIMLTNLSKQMFKEFIGARVYDRMQEDGGRELAFDWASYRDRYK